MTVRLPRRSGSGKSVTGQGKRHIERWRWSCVVDDVGADSQPIRRQIRVADPRLQIARDRHPGRHDGPRGRKEQKVATTRNQDLWSEEIVTRRQKNRSGEGDADFNLLAGCWPLTMCSAVGLLVDAVYNGVQDHGVGVQEAYCKAKGPQARIAGRSVNFDIRR